MPRAFTKMDTRKRIIVKKGNVDVPSTMNKVALFCLNNKVTFTVDFAGNKYMLDEPPGIIAETMDSNIFFRANRKTILHLETIKDFRIIEFGGILISLAMPDWIRFIDLFQA